MRLDDDMQRVVREQSLGFVATVCPDGTANVSPKGTLTVWDDEHLVFLHIHSPGHRRQPGHQPVGRDQRGRSAGAEGLPLQGRGRGPHRWRAPRRRPRALRARARDGPGAGASGRAPARRRGGAGRLPRLRRRRQRGGHRAALARPPPRPGGGSAWPRTRSRSLRRRHGRLRSWLVASSTTSSGCSTRTRRSSASPTTGHPSCAAPRSRSAPGRHLSALVWGEAPPELVLLHGGAQNAHTWDTVAMALGRPLVAIDLPGHGHSDAPAEGSLDVRSNAADVAAVDRRAGARGVAAWSACRSAG